MNMDTLTKMATDFWLKTGKPPTHVLVTPAQHTELSETFSPRMRVGEWTKDTKVSTLHLGVDCIVDVVPVGIMNMGKHHHVDFPKMIRLED